MLGREDFESVLILLKNHGFYAGYTMLAKDAMDFYISNDVEIKRIMRLNSITKKEIGERYRFVNQTYSLTSHGKIENVAEEGRFKSLNVGSIVSWIVDNYKKRTLVNLINKLSTFDYRVIAKFEVRKHLDILPYKKYFDPTHFELLYEELLTKNTGFTLLDIKLMSLVSIGEKQPIRYLKSLKVNSFLRKLEVNGICVEEDPIVFKPTEKLKIRVHQDTSWSCTKYLSSYSGPGHSGSTGVIHNANNVLDLINKVDLPYGHLITKLVSDRNMNIEKAFHDYRGSIKLSRYDL